MEEGMNPPFSPHLLGLLPSGLSDWLQSRGQPGYRARQIQQWLCAHRALSLEQMTDLPLTLRAELKQAARLWTTEIIHHSQDNDGTEKLLLRLADGSRIECVLLRDGQRRTICISSQVGCAMGCVFCASGLDGVDRNLTTGEIIEQILRLQQLLPEDERLSHIVVMGMGEPLANLDQLLPALSLANDPAGLGISVRRVTISTVGIPQAIRRLCREETHYHLAVSLHAPNDRIRSQIVPTNQSIGLQAILEAADEYFTVSGRRLTFEYVLLGGINDHPEHARSLATLLAGRPALLNVIPYNPVKGLEYVTPSRSTIEQFCAVLQQAGIEIQERQRKGSRINAACGQLRRVTPDSTLDQAKVPSSNK